MAVPTTSLVLLTNVSTEFQSSSEVSFTDADTITTIEAIIQDVTGMIEGGVIGIDRRVVVRKYTQYTKREDWRWDPARDKYVTRSEQWPIVQIDTSSITAGATDEQTEDNIFLSASRRQDAIVYYAGYKRSEQSLANLQTILPSLSVLPSTMPFEVRGAAIEGVIYKLFERRHGPGVADKILNPAIQQVVLQGPRPTYLKEMFHDRMRHLKRLTA